MSEDIGEKLLRALVARYNGEIAGALATLEIYIKNPVGIFRHLTEPDRFNRKINDELTFLEF